MLLADAEAHGKRQGKAYKPHVSETPHAHITGQTEKAGLVYISKTDVPLSFLIDH